jgi:hypothetical protein
MIDAGYHVGAPSRVGILAIGRFVRRRLIEDSASPITRFVLNPHSISEGPLLGPCAIDFL